MKNSFVLIFTGPTIEAQRLVSEIRALGIRPIVKDEGESGRLAGFGVSHAMQTVWVHKEEEKQVKNLF